VLPPAAPLFAVGGLGEDHVADFRRAGASGAGIGSALYRPGVATAELGARASRLMAAWQGALHRN
jgi:2-dehydro-3-deoxyphosphogalactonate aldolase